MSGNISIGLPDYITKGGAMEVNSTTTTILSRATFRDAIWLFPPAFTLHVLEEWPRFTNWAKRYASPLFTQQEYTTLFRSLLFSQASTHFIAFAASVSSILDASGLCASYLKVPV